MNDNKVLTVDEFITKLAEKLACGDISDASPCDMCIHKSCDSQVSGLTCLRGIEQWLKALAEEFTAAEGEKGTTTLTVCQELYPQPKMDATGMWKWKDCQWMDSGLGFPPSGIDDYAPLHRMAVLQPQPGSLTYVVADIRVSQTDVTGSPKWMWVYTLKGFRQGDMRDFFTGFTGPLKVEGITPNK